MIWMQNFSSQSTWDHASKCADEIFGGLTTSNKITFVRDQKCGREGRLKFKINVLFYGDDLRIVALVQVKFCTVKYREHTYKSYLNHFCLTTLLNMAVLRNLSLSWNQS
jgi:hypothetical protein